MTPPALQPVDYVDPQNVVFVWSFVWDLGLFVVGIAAIVWMFAKARSLANAHTHDQKEMLDLAARPLSEGSHRVVCGKVDTDEGDDVAVELVIEQTVYDNRGSQNHSTSHAWHETGRKVRVSPFYLVCESGDVVYVDPPQDVIVADLIDTTYPMDLPRKRIRSADVRRGETFNIYGDLALGPHPRAQSAFREGGSGWILRSPRTRMLFASDIIDDRSTNRISYLRSAAAIFAVAFVAFHLAMTIPFLYAALFGKVTTANVIGRKTSGTVNKGSDTAHYNVTVQAPDGVVLSQDVRGPLYDAVGPIVPGAAPATLPMLEVGHSASTSWLGTTPNIGGFYLFAGTLFSVAAFFGMWRGQRARMAWYDKPKLDEPSENGWWTEPRPGAPVSVD